MTLDDLLGDEFTRRIGEGRKRIPAGVWVAAVIAGVAVMGRNLFRGGMITASGLLGTPHTLIDGFHYALTGAKEPWLLVSAATSVLSVEPKWFPIIALTTAFPITMVVAAWFLRKRIDHGGLRWLASAGYAFLPILMGGLNRGALWFVLLAILFPFIAEWISRLPLPWMGARSLQTLAGIILTGVFIIAIAPLLWVPVIAAALVVAIRAGGTARIVRTLISVLLPIGFWIQSLPYFIENPTRLFLTPEAMLTPVPTTWEMFLGRPFDVGVPPMWLSIAVFAALWLAAVIVVIRDPSRRWLVLIGAGVITVGMWFSQLSLPLAITHVHPDASPWLLIGFSLLVFALASWMDKTLESVEGRDFGAVQALIALVSLFIIAASVLSAGWGIYAGMTDVVRGTDQSIPEYIGQNEVELDTGTLIIDSKSKTWNLRFGGQTMWGQASALSGILEVDSVVDTFEQIVARAVEGRPDDTAADQLATAGVNTVVVLNPSAETVIALDATAGFQRGASGEGIEIWAITQDGLSPTRRSLVREEDPPIYLNSRDDVPAGERSTLILAQPPDPLLHVFVGDQELRPTPSGDWRAAYSLAGASGPIRIEQGIDRLWAAWIQLGVVGLLIIFAIPPLTARSDSEETPRQRVRRAR